MVFGRVGEKDGVEVWSDQKRLAQWWRSSPEVRSEVDKADLLDSARSGDATTNLMDVGEICSIEFMLSMVEELARCQ